MSGTGLPHTVTAVDMARSAGVEPKRFRAALRQANLAWHSHNGRWEVRHGGVEHRDMIEVLALLTPAVKTATARELGASRPRSPSRVDSDEAWIIGLCDEVLGEQSLRQYKFPFLTGDPGVTGRRSHLPVDAFYPAWNLVVEFHEIQHSQSVTHFDKRQTVSGVSRAEQRNRYDELRRTILPVHGIDLVIFDYTDFEHTAAGRLKRTSRDHQIIEQRLRNYIKP